MNIFSIPLTQLLSVLLEGEGGLFDFNATLPFMAIQFILLTVLLTFIFYKPISNTIKEREAVIEGNLADASAKLIKADELSQQYDEKLKDGKLKAQAILAAAESEAKESVAATITEVRADSAKLLSTANKELEAQKWSALLEIEAKIDDLSELIKQKLLLVG